MPFRCLLVDDSARFLESARLLLERESVQVDVTGTGTEAVRRFAQSHPGVVVLDIDLDGESGFEVVQRLQGATPAVPSGGDGPRIIDGARIILVSTHAEEGYEELIEASLVLGGHTDVSCLRQHGQRQRRSPGPISRAVGPLLFRSRQASPVSQRESLMSRSAT
jgi:CheY-like chemotaxis protein